MKCQSIELNLKWILFEKLKGKLGWRVKGLEIENLISGKGEIGSCKDNVLFAIEIVYSDKIIIGESMI